MSSETYNTLDDAITAHVRGSDGGEGLFVTGWNLVASVSSSEIDRQAHDGYMMLNSEGLAHHTIVGLLTVALQDRNNMSMMNMLSQGSD